MADLASRLQSALGTAYRVERELGGGGMSHVFVAEDVELGRKVVVKVLPPEMAAGVNAERFGREIRLAASLQHPHIVPLLAAGHTDDLVWYTMPLIEGQSLREKLAREGELPIVEAVRILRDVADALSYAHAHGVVHRDIKPDNVLISGRHAVVTDFGVAKAISESTGASSLTSVGIALGTPAYMAPEQAAAEPHVDHRADIYALGAMAYELLSGQPPFAGSPQVVLAAHVTQAPEVITARRSAVPPALGVLVMRCLEKKPADRWQSAAELHQQLDLMATPSGGMTPTASVPATTARGDVARPRNLRATAVLAVLVLVGVALGIWKPWSARSGALPLDANVVAVLPFRVAGADPSLQYLRQGMVDLLQAKLTGEGGPRAADARSVLAAVRDAGGSENADVAQDALLKVARRVGAGRILQGSIVGPPEHVVISATLLAMPGARTVAQTSVEGPKDSLFAMLDRFTAQLLALGAGASATQLSALTTTSLDALRAYLDGVHEYRRGAFTNATHLLARAVQLDSTFVLAASALIESTGWSNAERVDVGRVSRLAWTYRDRLSARDRLLLDIRVGSRYPLFTPWQVQIADAERMTQTMPESPDAWYYVGDAYFHSGLLAGFSDARERAATAFQRSVERDSLFAGPLSHLVALAQERGDVAMLQRIVPRVLALDTGSEGAIEHQWALASARHDEQGMRAVLSGLRAVSFVEISAFFLDSQLGDSTGLAHTDTTFAVWRERASTSAERGQYYNWRHVVDLEEGRPLRARVWLDSLAATDLSAAARSQVLGALIEDGDSAGIESRLQALRPADDRLLAVWGMIRGDAIATDRFLGKLRTDSSFADSTGLWKAQYFLVLEAWAAAQRRLPNALALVEAADSSMRGVHFNAIVWNPVIARLFMRLGKPDRALAALRRRRYGVTSELQTGLAEKLRLEGQLAAQTGDRTGAILAYRRYLVWRSDPEPSRLPQRDSVVAELARLERRP